MMSFRGAWLVLFALISFGIRAAHADDCLISGPRYQLQSDTVEWRIGIASGQSCVRGMRFSNVTNLTINLTSPPQSGQVTLAGPGFRYTAKTNFQGEDSFVLGISGTINRVNGTSTIRVLVSVVGTP
jgi:hypothetical protein